MKHLYTQVSRGLKSDPRFRVFVRCVMRELGWPEASAKGHALWCLCELWGLLIEDDRRDGVFPEQATSLFLASAAEYEGAPEAFVDNLLTAGLLRRENGSLLMVGFEERYRPLFNKRDRNRDAQARYRARTKEAVSAYVSHDVSAYQAVRVESRDLEAKKEEKGGSPLLSTQDDAAPFSCLGDIQTQSQDHAEEDIPPWEDSPWGSPPVSDDYDMATYGMDVDEVDALPPTPKVDDAPPAVALEEARPSNRNTPWPPADGALATTASAARRAVTKALAAAGASRKSLIPEGKTLGSQPSNVEMVGYFINAGWAPGFEVPWAVRKRWEALSPAPTFGDLEDVRARLKHRGKDDAGPEYVLTMLEGDRKQALERGAASPGKSSGPKKYTAADAVDFARQITEATDGFCVITANDAAWFLNKRIPLALIVATAKELDERDEVRGITALQMAVTRAGAA